MKIKQNIVVDIDGVIADIDTPWLFFVNEQYKTDLKKKDIQTYGFMRQYPLNEPKYKIMYRDARPYPYSQLYLLK